MREPIRSNRRPSRLPAPASVAGLLLLACASVASVSAPPPPAPGRLTEDEDDAAFHRQAVQRAIRENCLMCHTDELIHSQRLTPQQWKAEVEKMVGWGSPLPDELREPVTSYLAAAFAADTPGLKPDVLPLGELTGPVPAEGRAHDVSKGDPERGEALYARNCANCHGKDAGGAELGTNLVEKPVLLSTAEYDRVVREGRGRMPGFAGALDARAGSDILAWLRSRRYDPVGGAGR